MGNKIKHLEFIQSVIQRMANHSFLLKSWCTTFVAALFTFATKDANTTYILVAFMPVLVFWAIDAYFLSQERSYRALYDKVRRQDEREIDFSMNIGGFDKGKNSWASSLFATVTLIFYMSLIVIMIVTMGLLI